MNDISRSGMWLLDLKILTHVAELAFWKKLLLLWFVVIEKAS